MTTQPTINTDARYIELDTARKIRVRNKLYYRFNHWPILGLRLLHCAGTLDLHGFRARVQQQDRNVAGRGHCGYRNRRPARTTPGMRAGAVHHPLYRGQAESSVSPHLLHDRMGGGHRVRRPQCRGMGLRRRLGRGRLKQMYDAAYFPIAGTMWLLGALGLLPRVKRSTAGEGHERRYFYGAVWAVTLAQPVLWVLWKVLPISRTADAIKLVTFLAILAIVGYMSRRGLLPRTRPIVPGEWAVSGLMQAMQMQKGVVESRPSRSALSGFAF
jgi:hypothetical protein